MSPEVAALLSQIDLLGKDIALADAPEKQAKLRAAALNLSAALEPDSDIVERISFQYLDNVAIRIAIQLNIFEILVNSEEPKSLTDIFEITKADSVLLGRLLNHLTGLDAVAQVGKDLFAPSRKSRVFAVPHQAAALKYCFDFCGPIWQQVPSFLAETKYTNPTDPSKTATQVAYQTDDPFFKVMTKRPDVFETFNLWMTGIHHNRASWLDSYPFRERIIDSVTDDEEITFIDVGGGRGHETVTLKNRFPDLKGRFILQDLPQVFTQDLDLPSDIEIMPYDFFTPQSVHGAKVYFFRHIFHAFADHICLQILSRTREAMTPSYSRILISDWIIPSQIATQKAPISSPPRPLQKLPEPTHPQNPSRSRSSLKKLFCVGSSDSHRSPRTTLSHPQSPEATAIIQNAPLPPSFATSMDINMLAMTAGQERTEQQWQELMARAGLRVVGFWGPRDGRGTAIVEVIRD